jgi:hypothetical protein
MRLLPFEEMVIETGISKDETVAVLLDNIDQKSGFRWGWKSPDKKFEGNFKTNDFEIKRSSWSKNSFQAMIKGRIRTSGNTAKIFISMRLHWTVIVFLVVFIGFCLTGALLGLFEEDTSTVLITTPASMALFVYVMAMGGFWYDSYKAKKTLLEITKGKLVEGE